MCGCEYYIYEKSMHLSLLSWSGRFLKKLKYQSFNAQNRSYGEMTNVLFETYKILSCRMEIICFIQNMTWKCEQFFAYPLSKYTLPHWECVLCFCVKFPRIDLPSTESYHHNSNVSPTICFHVYQHISHCTVHGRHPFNKKNSVSCVRLLKMQL